MSSPNPVPAPRRPRTDARVPTIPVADDRIPRLARGTTTEPLGAVDVERADRPISDGLWREPLWSIWARRFVSVPVLVAVTAVYAAILPAVLLYCVVYDVVRRRPLLLTRFHLTIFAVLAWHVIGIILLILYWIGLGRWFGLRIPQWRPWNAALEGWWGDKIFGITERIHGMTMEVNGDDLLVPGPVIVFARHTSVIDTMLPLRLLEHYHGMFARIVKKRELLWDPCVDGVSRRMPRTFVRRGSGNRDLELANLERLADGMGARDGIWIYPEGTRFTPSKRERILASLRDKRPEAAARAEELRFTLPPRPAGALALLDRCADADVVFCAHTGLEGANRLGNIINGSLYRRRVKIQFWRVPASQIPSGSNAREQWLHDWWLEIDRWVEANQDTDLTDLLRGE